MRHTTTKGNDMTTTTLRQGAESIRELGIRDSIDPRNQRLVTVFVIDPVEGPIEEIDVVAGIRVTDDQIKRWLPAVLADTYELDGMTLEVDDFNGMTIH
ncbi:hypothetical protein SEA_YAKULT_31 [Gordonia phage Yakult]|nr:hypothetical protein SEA_YAKULT_31 [Gordonia phage Yakult]